LSSAPAAAAASLPLFQPWSLDEWKAASFSTFFHLFSAKLLSILKENLFSSFLLFDKEKENKST
jgi:hypothetical protein